MKDMFSNSIQPSIVSLFSSTSADPLQLFKTHLDASLAADSSIHLLHDTKSLPLPAAPAMMISPPTMIEHNGDDSENVGYSLNQTVLQIQSPTLRTTYIHCPPAGGPGHIRRSFRGARDKSNDLGIRHPWLHIQVRNMGREWSFEVGVVDQSNRMGIIRLSTFQVRYISFIRTLPRSPFLDPYLVNLDEKENRDRSVRFFRYALSLCPMLKTHSNIGISRNSLA